MPTEEKILATKPLQKPITKKDVRSVLGLMGLLLKNHIPNYAELAHPRTELTKGEKIRHVCWN